MLPLLQSVGTRLTAKCSETQVLLSPVDNPMEIEIFVKLTELTGPFQTAVPTLLCIQAYFVQVFHN